MSPAPVNDLPSGSYGLIYADPPWRFTTYSAKGKLKKAAELHYPTMTLDDIMALPVRRLAAQDSVLVLWATAPMLIEALAVMGAWGFDYKTCGVWAKRSATGARWAFGTGYHLRSAHETFLIGSRGKPKIGARDVRSLIEAPVREHSRKPDEMYSLLERLYPCERRIELFARTERAGWTSWGDEVGKMGVAA